MTTEQKAWRWGYWKLFRDDRPICEYKFSPPDGYQEECSLILSTMEYGTLNIDDGVKGNEVLHSVPTGYSGETTIIVSEENKALIAAAPRLLEIIEKIHTFHPIGKSHGAGSKPDICFICEAITKAKGE